jgi:hypothetical protein
VSPGLFRSKEQAPVDQRLKELSLLSHFLF